MALQHKNGNTGIARDHAGASRRRRLMAWMRTQKRPVPGSALARHFKVSRQCLVQDVAILRAAGEEILSAPQGYRLPSAQVSGHRAIVACKHTPDKTEEELQVFVDHGVRVLDVVVEHPLYGELRGALMIESRADVQDFTEKWRREKATLLSSLTGGVHLHTVEAHKPEMIERAKAQLQERGILLK
jgi:transcriptional regulator of NAD metabolism